MSFAFFLQVIVPIEQYLIREHTSMGRCKHVEPEFRDKAVEEEKVRKRVMTETEQADTAKEARQEEDKEQDDKEEDVNPMAADGDGQDGDNDGWEEFQGGVDFDDPGDLGDDENEVGRAAGDADVLGAMLGQTATQQQQEEEEAAGPSNGGGAVSYEELVMKRVSEYVQQSQEYIESTDLAKRVGRWHSSIRPRLEAVEKRERFDIHRYGSDILEKFPRSERGDAAQRKTTVTFKDCVAGKDKEEVCRYFLSALMLANTYNIDLSSGEAPEETTTVEGDPNDSVASEKSTTSSKKTSKLGRKKGSRTSVGTTSTGKSGRTAESLPMDKVELTLLSTVRHHEEIMRYDEENALVNGEPMQQQDAEGEVISKGKKSKSGGKGGKSKNSRKRKLDLDTVEEEESDAILENGVS